MIIPSDLNNKPFEDFTDAEVLDGVISTTSKVFNIYIQMVAKGESDASAIIQLAANTFTGLGRLKGRGNNLHIPEYLRDLREELQDQLDNMTYKDEVPNFISNSSALVIIAVDMIKKSLSLIEQREDFQAPYKFDSFIEFVEKNTNAFLDSQVDEKSLEIMKKINELIDAFLDEQGNVKDMDEVNRAIVDLVKKGEYSPKGSGHKGKKIDKIEPQAQMPEAFRDFLSQSKDGEEEDDE